MLQKNKGQESVLKCHGANKRIVLVIAIVADLIIIVGSKSIPLIHVTVKLIFL